MPKKKSKRNKRTSSGRSVRSRINRQIRRTKMKIRRWHKYAMSRRGNKKWDTSGLERHIEYLENLL